MFKGEIRCTIDAPDLETMQKLADRVCAAINSWPFEVELFAVYIVDENGKEIEGA